MAAILPGINIDSDATLARYFLPYQLQWIADDSRMRLAEKSVRIGWTYCDAFKNVRKRLHHPRRDYLFATKDQASAIEYLDTCKRFAELFDYAKSIVAHDIETTTVEARDAEGKKFTQEIKFGYIKFDNGSRILAFSANPYAMAVFGGDVGLDEFAKHQQDEKLWETAQGRITWGYDIGVWSAHDGTDTLFYQFSREAAAGKGGWSHYKVTMEEAVDLGLLDKINAASSKKWTKEEFIQDCKNRARLPEIYEQAYNCNPTGSASAIVPWTAIQQCRVDRPLNRLHLEKSQILDMFGPFRKETEVVRQRKIADFVKSSFAKVFNEPQRYRIGFDVAASGEGDLCAIYTDRKETNQLKLDALFTCRTDDWDFIETVLWTHLRSLSAVQGCGDETGLGRQVCWRTSQQFPNQFKGINFSSKKHEMGFSIMNQLSTAEKIFPAAAEHDDVAQDYFSIRKTYSGGRWHFTSGRNNLNPASHGDIAWAGALSSEADKNQAVTVAAHLIGDDAF